MTETGFAGGRARAYLEFIAAVIFYFLVRAVAHRGAAELASEIWSPLLQQSILVLLLIVGFAAFGIVFDRQKHPLSDQGLPLRSGWVVEGGLGIAFGWALAVVCVLLLVVSGGIAIVLSTQRSAWGWLVVDGLFFAVAAMAEEVAFRGYGFQRVVRVVGPLGASLGFAVYYAVVQALQPGSNLASLAVSIVFSLVLSAAYLRTKALWVGWGLNFGWKASRALIFGLAVSGVTSHSSVVEGDPMGPVWVTGGGFGLDGSWIVFLVLLAALPFAFRLTRELDFRYNAPEIVPGGVPVDLDAASQRHHNAAMESPAPANPLVQILPAGQQAASNHADEIQRHQQEGTG